MKPLVPTSTSIRAPPPPPLRLDKTLLQPTRWSESRLSGAPPKPVAVVAQPSTSGTNEFESASTLTPKGQLSRAASAIQSPATSLTQSLPRSNTTLTTSRVPIGHLVHSRSPQQSQHRIRSASMSESSGSSTFEESKASVDDSVGTLTLRTANKQRSSLPVSPINEQITASTVFPTDSAIDPQRPAKPSIAVEKRVTKSSALSKLMHFKSSTPRPSPQPDLQQQPPSQQAQTTTSSKETPPSSSSTSNSTFSSRFSLWKKKSFDQPKSTNGIATTTSSTTSRETTSPTPREYMHRRHSIAAATPLQFPKQSPFQVVPQNLAQLARMQQEGVTASPAARKHVLVVASSHPLI